MSVWPRSSSAHPGSHTNRRPTREGAPVTDVSELDNPGLLRPPSAPASLPDYYFRPRPAGVNLAGSQREPEWQIQPLLRQGLELLRSGRITEGATPFLQAARLEPTNVDALTGVAHCALAIGETELARQFLKHILALDPEHQGARASLSALEGETNAEQVGVS